MLSFLASFLMLREMVQEVLRWHVPQQHAPGKIDYHEHSTIGEKHTISQHVYVIVLL